LSGFFVLIVGLDGNMAGISSLIDSALMAVVDLVGGSPPGGSPLGAAAAGAH
jgi:hypothetical protein